jgi:hypothetical protein
LVIQPFIWTSNLLIIDVSTLLEVYLPFCLFPSVLSTVLSSPPRAQKCERERWTWMALPIGAIDIERIEASQYVSGEYAAVHTHVPLDEGRGFFFENV